MSDALKLPGRDDLPSGVLLGDLSDRERQDDDEFWQDYWLRRGGTEPEDLEER